MNIQEIVKHITPVNEECVALAQKRFDNLIKPVGSLAKLEEMVTRYAGITSKTDKNELDYPKRNLLVWGSIENISDAEKIMVGNFPVNVLAEQAKAEVIPLLVLSQTKEEALLEGATLVSEYIKVNGLGILGFGALCEDELVLAAMTGGILQAAALKVGIMLDGVATCKAALEATKLAPEVGKYCFAGHVSAEAGAEEILTELGLSAPLRLNIDGCAGEGAVVAFTLFDAGLKAYKEMETFAEAGVHVEVKEYSLAEQKKQKL